MVYELKQSNPINNQFIKTGILLAGDTGFYFTFKFPTKTYFGFPFYKIIYNSHHIFHFSLSSIIYFLIASRAIMLSIMLIIATHAVTAFLREYISDSGIIPKIILSS